MSLEPERAPERAEDRLRTAVERQYARRTPDDWTYSPLAPHYLAVRQEIERNLHACVRLACERRGASRANWRAVLENLRVLDVGCGEGTWLGVLVSMGLQPRNLRGVELLGARAQRARERLAPAVEITQENFLAFEESGFDLILFFVVLSSILDEGHRAALARTALEKLRPGGSVVVFDFVYDNPRNPDVKRVTHAQLEGWFRGCSIAERTALLLPPIARLACRVHPSLYRWLNVPPLRSHRFWTITPQI